MTKIFLILFVLLVCSSIGKAEESEEITDNTENTKSDDDEDESASIQVVQRATSKEDTSLIKYDDNSQGEDNYTTVVKDTNLTKVEAKYDTFFEDLISDSGDNISLENRDENNDEVLIPTAAFIEENNEYSNGQGKIDIVLEDITKAYNNDEKSKEDSTIDDEDGNNWRSAEHLNTDDKNVNEAVNEESVEDESVEDYMDKKIEEREVRGRMDTRQPERRQYLNTRPINYGQYRPPEDHDPGVMRTFNEMMVPRFRPVLTRNGIVFTPTLFPLQTRQPSLLDRLSVRNWVPNMAHLNPEPDPFKLQHSRINGVPQYEDSKMIDDYNDYGPNTNTNTYSYTPVRKATTQAPPQQIAAPNKFDIFQKLMEASNHPKSQKRMFNEFSGSYHSQRQYLS